MSSGVTLKRGGAETEIKQFFFCFLILNYYIKTFELS